MCSREQQRTSNPGYGLSVLQHKRRRRDNTLAVAPLNAISVVAGARNHLQADRSLGFCFEIRI
jgi:hypothetical protein